MSQRGRANRKRAAGLAHRNETCRMEWSQASRWDNLLLWTTAPAEVDKRQSGRCCFPGCQEPIAAYPHAIWHQAGGVHDAINRAGVCQQHSAEVHGVDHGQGPPRAYLTTYLQQWYAQTGITPEQWTSLATRRPEARSG